ncbi:hypothetical protein ACFP9V_03905 [Deinococcus radiopugnans]|uniref:hypothetical protein n=1 Tax=Deinococcus radiopugnans TaxID=57497 RepID=UPI003616F167
MMVAERALRTSDVWQIEGGLPVYRERQPGITISYHDEGLDLFDELMRQFSKLGPRTADVWTLLRAEIHRGKNADGYQAVSLDARTVARDLGYKLHPHGGVRTSDLLEIESALKHIERVRIEISPVERSLKRVGKNGRKTSGLQRVYSQRLIAVMGKREQRTLRGVTCHVIWDIALGAWVDYFHRSYAPMPSVLTALSARGSNLWAKQIGKELAYWYRIDHHGPQRRTEKRIRVGQLLTWACLLPTVAHMRSSGNRRRPREYFEAALDKLEGLGILDHWHYAERDAAKMRTGAGVSGAVDQWLASIVVIQAPRPGSVACHSSGTNLPQATDLLPTPN